MEQLTTLETSTCIEYSIRYSYNYRGKRRTFSPLGNQLIAKFVGYCKTKLIKIMITDTVENEVKDTIVKVISRIFEKYRIRYIIRRNIKGQIMKRLNRLIESRDEAFCTVSSKIKEVRQFYNSLLKKLDTKTKLQAIAKKQRRRSLIPGKTDLTILGEAHNLCYDYDILFISKDSHFTEFKEEIKEKLNISVFDILDLTKFIS